VELPAGLHRDLTTYAAILSRETGQPATDPVRLIVPMLERFMATDRGFAKAKRPLGDLAGRLTSATPPEPLTARG
jgi:hypothetical protein